MTKNRNSPLVVVLTALFCTNGNAQGNANAFCDQARALWRADSTIKRMKYNLKELEASVRMSDSLFIIEYLPIRKDIRGSGAEISIEKSSCRVRKIERYQ